MTRRVAALTAASGFTLFALAVHFGWSPLLRLDHSVGTSVRVSPLSTGWVQAFWLWVGHLTDTLAMTVYTTVIVVMLLIRGFRRIALWVAATMSTVGVLNAGLKVAFARTRPDWDDPLQVLASYSFPSGHSSGIAAFAGVVVVLALVFAAGNRLVSVLVASAAAALVLLVGFDRLALGVHHVSDVLAGYLLGALVVQSWLLILPPTHRRTDDCATESAAP